MTRLAALFFVIVGLAKPLFAQSVDREPVLSKAPPDDRASCGLPSVPAILR
jgi:hypothetical protein